MILDSWPDPWRLAVATFLVAAVVRSGPIGLLLPQTLWYAIQFGPLLIAALLLFAQQAKPLRRIDLALYLSLALYAFCALLSTLTSRYRTNTLEQTAILTFMFGFLVSTAWRRWSFEAVIDRDLAWIVGVVAGIQAVGLLGFVTHRAWAVADYGRFQGLFDNANYAGVISALAIALGIYLAARSSARARALSAGAVVVAAIALVASGSRGGFLALLAGLTTFAVLRFNRRVAIATAAIGVLLAIALVLAPFLPPSLLGPFSRTVQATDLSSGRIQIYTELLARWTHSPWLGIGYRTTELLTGTKHFTGHNVYLSVLAETGLLGATAFVALLALAILSGPMSLNRRSLLAAVVAVLAIEVTESSLFGWGSPITLPEWLTLIAFAALGRVEALPYSRDAGRQAAASGEVGHNVPSSSSPRSRQALPAPANESSERRP